MAPQRPARPAARAPKGPAPRTSYRGDAGRRQMEEEQVRQEAAKEARKAKGFEPFRFWTPVGETRQIVIIDDAPDFFRYEHALKSTGSNRYDNFLPCINEDANCPACSVSEKPAYFAMYLSVIDLTPYNNKDGDEVPWSKKMLVVKPSQQKKISRLFEREGSLRGMILDMTRDGDKDAAIGNDIEFVGWMEEEELATYYSEYEDKDKKVQVIDCLEPFDYDTIYPEMTEEQLATIAGVTDHGVGNRRQTDRSIGRGGREAEAPARGGRSAGRREEAATTRPARGRQAPADDGGDDQQDAPQRGRRAPAEAPAPRGRRAPAEAEAPAPRGRRAPPPPADDYQDDDQYVDDAPAAEEPPARGRRAPAAEAPARGRRSTAPAEDAPQRPARGGRAAAADAEPPFEEEPPARGRTALRGRRN